MFTKEILQKNRNKIGLNLQTLTILTILIYKVIETIKAKNGNK